MQHNVVMIRTGDYGMKLKNGTIVEMQGEVLDAWEKLTALQQRYVTNILDGMNKTQAYMQAGGTSKTYTAAGAVANRMSKNANVVTFLSRVTDGTKEAACNAIMTREEMLKRLTLIARCDIRDVVDIRNEDGQGRWSFKEDITPEAAGTIAELTASKDGLKVKQHAPLAAMKQLAELCGFNDPKRVELSGEVHNRTTLADFYASEATPLPDEEDA